MSKPDKPFKPMLASPCTDITKLRFPVIVSPKLDGIRAIVRDGQLVSRKLKPIPNVRIQEKFKGLPEGFDGELMVRGTDFSGTTSIVMASDKPADDVEFHVFDMVRVEGYWDRLYSVGAMVPDYPGTELVSHVRVDTPEELTLLEMAFLAEGYEGAMIRSIDGPYKFGRSTEKEGYLLKLKRFSDEEVTVIGFEPLYTNTNEATKDNLGRTERSSKNEGMVAQDTLGALKCITDDDVLFSIGTGFDQEQRKEIWDNQKKYLKKRATVKFQEKSKDGVPRFPVFKGFREDI